MAKRKRKKKKTRSGYVKICRWVPRKVIGATRKRRKRSRRRK